MANTTNKISVGTTPTLIASAQSRTSITITLEEDKDIWLGNSSVTINDGFHLQPIAGASFSLTRPDAIYGVTNSGTALISYYQD